MINMSGKLNKYLKAGLHDDQILRFVLSSAIAAYFSAANFSWVNTSILKYSCLINSFMPRLS